MNPSVLARRWLLPVITLVVLFVHSYRIADLPAGFYLDETSIGLNAALMAENAVDEHGQSWPIYFKAFGENKNPIYIYAAAAIFKVLGTSEWALRMTSFTFFAAAYALFYLLVSRLWRGDRLLIAWSLIGFGTLPYFFSVSRISFEVISQLTWVTAIALAAFQLLNADNTRRLLAYALICGVLIGTSIYTYSTARLLSLATLFSLALCLGKLTQVEGKRILFLTLDDALAFALLLVSFSVCLVPYLIFIQDNPGGLTGRFLAISFLDDPIPLFEKLGHLLANYLSYWGPNFLVFKAEGNFRHAIGYAGAIYGVVYVLGLIALYVWIRYGVFIRDRFVRFILLSWLAAPLAASTINELHLLRSMTFGLYWLLAATYGFRYVLLAIRRQNITAAKRLLLGVLAVEASLYVLAYFIVFPERSVHGSESYDVKATYESALARQPGKIWFFAEPAAAYPNMAFRRHTVKNPDNVPVEIFDGSRLLVNEGECVIYSHWSENKIRSRSPITYSEANVLEPNFLQKMLKIWPKEHITRLRCF